MDDNRQERMQMRKYDNRLNSARNGEAQRQQSSEKGREAHGVSLSEGCMDDNHCDGDQELYSFELTGYLIP